MVKERALPNTGYAVLGLLSRGEELSGYEVRKAARAMRFFYWSPAQSQVYSELERLRKRGYVTAREVPQEGKPDKRLYKVTNAGADALSAWIELSEIEPTVMKHSVLLKLAFGHMTSPRALAGMLERFVDETRATQGQLAIVQEFMEDEPGYTYQAMAVEWSYHHLEAEVLMATSLIARLGEKIALEDATQS